MAKKLTKQSSPKPSTLAFRVMSGDKKATPAEARRLPACVLSQDETRGQKSKK